MNYKALVWVLIAFGLVTVMPYGLNHSNFFNGTAGTYALEYNTSKEYVYIELKPHDCEWAHAPLGDKACHYEKHIQTDRRPIDFSSIGAIPVAASAPAVHPHTEVYVGWVRVDD